MTAHPPGAPALETVLSGYGVCEAAVTPDTVPAMAPLPLELPAGFLAVSVYDGFSGQPLRDVVIKPIDTGQPATAFASRTVDYPLRR